MIQTSWQGLDSEQRRLIAEALYIKAAVLRTGNVIAQCPNGRVESIRFFIKAMPVVDGIVADLTGKAAEIGRRKLQEKVR